MSTTHNTGSGSRPAARPAIVPITGKDGLRGTLDLRSHPMDGSQSHVVITLDTGQRVTVPESLLVPRADGGFYLPIGPGDLRPGPGSRPAEPRGDPSDGRGASQGYPSDPHRPMSWRDATQAYPSRDASQAYPPRDASQAYPPRDATRPLPPHATADSASRTGEPPVQAGEAAAREGLEVARIPVLAESLEVHVRKVDTGVVRIVKQVHEHSEVVEQPVRRQEVHVERIPVNRVLEAPLQARYEGDTLVVPVMEEMLVVEKRLMLREELRITTREIEVRQEIPVTLRREAVTVEREAAGPGATGGEETP